MTVLGIVGVGHLAAYTVTGIRRGGWDGRIVLSPRNAEVAARLAADCRCEVLSDNQAVADAADMVMLATRPGVALEVLSALKLRGEQILLSVVAGLPTGRLASNAGPVASIVRALPVTAAELSASPTLVYPANDEVETLLGHCGRTVPVPTEDDFEVGGVLACVYGWFFALFDQLTQKTVAAGLSPDAARLLVSGMAEGAARIAAAQTHQSLDEISRSIATEGTFTKLGLDHLEASDAFAPWRDAFDLLLARLRVGGAC